MLPEIAKTAMVYTVTDIGQLSKEDRRTLDKYVKLGYLSKGKGGPFPILKTVWAHPNFDFEAHRELAITEIFVTCKALGEDIKVTFAR